MASKKKGPGVPAFAISFGTTLAMLLFAFVWVEGFGFRKMVFQLAWPMVRLMFLISVGLAVGQIIEALGWSRKLASVAGPMFRFGKLGDMCGATFTTAFFSGAAANAMLSEFYTNGKITRKQLFLSNFINQFPAYFLHLPTTIFIIIPLTRWAGALYFLLTFAAVVLRTAAFLVYGHFQKNPPIADDPTAVETATPEKTKKGIWESVRKRLPKRIAGIAIYVLPVYTAVYVFNALGLFDYLKNGMAGFVVTSFIPMESLSVIILSFTAEFAGGFTAAGALLDAGILTVKQTVLALLIGNVIAFPIRALRHQIPRYVGVFSPGMGMQILLMGQGLRVVSLVIVGFVYYLVG